MTIVLRKLNYSPRSRTIFHLILYTLTPIVSPLLILLSLFCHQILENIYTHLKITPILLLSSKCNTNVTIEEGYNMQKFLIFAIHFVNFPHFDVASLLLLMPTHHKPRVWHLLGTHLLSFNVTFTQNYVLPPSSKASLVSHAFCA